MGRLFLYSCFGNFCKVILFSLNELLVGLLYSEVVLVRFLGGGEVFR